MAQRIVHVLDSSAARAGQIHAHLHGLVEALAALGIDSAVLATDGPRWRTVRPGPPLEAADVVHVHGLAPVDHPDIRSRLRDGGLVISPHGALLPSPWRRRGPIRRVRDWLTGVNRRYRRAAALLAATPTEADHLRAAGHHARIEQIDTTAAEPAAPADPALVAGLQDRRCLLYLNDLDPVEGLVPMLKACEQVVLAAPAWHLVIAGHERPRWLGMIRAAVERRRLTDRVTFVVDPTPAQQTALLQHCEVVCQPSLLDVTPYSVLAGWFAGTPCVVSTRCHAPMFDAACGWRVEPNRDALAEALMAVVGSPPAALADMGATGRAAMANHSWTALASQYKEFYATLRH